MIKVASINGRLRDPLPEWAEQVKTATDKAVHKLEAFESKHQGELEDILWKARKVVESLYGS
jgi:hypothetical protein